MLEAKLFGTAKLKRLLDAFKEFTDKVNFECDNEGIHLHAMDNSHFAIIVLKLDTSIFMDYVCDRPITFDVNLKSLDKALKRAEKGDTCTLKVSDDGDVLTLVYEEKYGSGVVECYIKLEEDKTDGLNITDVVYDAQVTISSSDFSLIVGHLNALGKNVTIKVSDEGVLFATKGDAISGNVFLTRCDSVKVGDHGAQIEMTQDVSLKFSLKYLVEFSKSATFSSTVQLKLRSDFPLFVSYKFVQGTIQYYLVWNEDYE